MWEVIPGNRGMREREEKKAPGVLLANYWVYDCSLILPRISGLHVECTSEPPSQRTKEAEVYLHPDVAEGFFLGAGGLLTKLCLTLATPWTTARHAPLSMEFSRQKHWGELLYLPPGDLPQPGDQTHVSCIAGRFFTTEPQGSLCFLQH